MRHDRNRQEIRGRLLYMQNGRGDVNFTNKYIDKWATIFTMEQFQHTQFSISQHDDETTPIPFFVLPVFRNERFLCRIIGTSRHSV